MKVQANGQDGGWTKSRTLAALEFALIAVIFVLDRPGLHVIYFSKTIYLAVLAAISLQIRRRWNSLGFSVHPNFGRILLAGLMGGVAMEALELLVTQPMLKRVYGIAPDLSYFASVKGNYQVLIAFLLFTWTLAAFGEEFVYRGYLLNRLEGVLAPLGERRVIVTLSLAFSSVIFGFAHFYQGAAGIIENVIAGLLLGLMYVASGRRLWVPVIAHGIQDTTDFLLIFSGHYPI